MKQNSFRVRWFEETGKWMGQCPEHMSLFHFDDDPVEAIKGIIEKVMAAEAAGATAGEGSIFKQMDDSLAGAPGAFGKMKQ